MLDYLSWKTKQTNPSPRKIPWISQGTSLSHYSFSQKISKMHFSISFLPNICTFDPPLHWKSLSSLAKSKNDLFLFSFYWSSETKFRLLELFLPEKLSLISNTLYFLVLPQVWPFQDFIIIIIIFSTTWPQSQSYVLAFLCSLPSHFYRCIFNCLLDNSIFYF